VEQSPTWGGEILEAYLNGRTSVAVRNIVEHWTKMKLPAGQGQDMTQRLSPT